MQKLQAARNFEAKTATSFVSTQSVRVEYDILWRAS